MYERKMFMLKFFAEGLLAVCFIFSFIFLVVGNMSLLRSWVKDFEKKKKWGHSIII